MAGTLNVVRFGGVSNASHVGNVSAPNCHPAQTTESVVLFSLAIVGMGANIFLMLLILTKKPLRRWSQGLLFHQGLVDCLRASLLIPLGISVFLCQRMPRCSIVETAFLLLVTVSTVNILTSVINDAPLLPEQTDVSNGGSDNGYAMNSENNHVVLDSPQCIIFGLFIIWFASFTINLGPTFLSGALSSAREGVAQIDACPMVYAPVRHYVLNVLWVTVNLMCVILTGIHLRKLYRDLTKSNLEALRIAGLVTTMISVRSERDLCESQHIQSYIDRLEKEGIRRVKMFVVLLVAYVIFWGPLFIVILIQPGINGPSSSYEMSLHVAFAHTFVNPTLILVLHKELRHASASASCCHSMCESQEQEPPYEPSPAACRLNRSYM
ncbi:g_PROTEIN_RECEP_F1_2 domain-containing protein [Nephila pilipes]|uniref:G_PROTEIN_RECEP_F1_2 domain-containing protein n=1 Tax=Nephila pilipes TaxID=299642 RepID=A0A8X6MNP5_NEPPI|nr:g_PROTEIN_RECEP_F1_2 domain-containing protein [Nephila pilipes]